jgi:tetratricopeptide (TPR) repeat protein
VSLAPDDPQVHTEQASFLIWQAENTPAADERSTLIGEAQKSLVRAWRLDKELAQVYFLTGKTYLMLNEDHDRAVEMLEQAVGMAPSNLNYRYRLAFAYARADRKEEAMALAQSMLYFSHGPDGIKKAAERLIESLEEQDD